MKHTVHGIIQKINFIETDIELHKQILVSIPTGQDDEMKQVIEKIAQLTTKAKKLKDSIKDIDPEEHNKIMKLEKAAEKFKNLSKDKKFTKVSTLDQDGKCTIKLKDGSIIECLVTAQDEAGDWTILTIDGETCCYSPDEIES